MDFATWIFWLISIPTLGIIFFCGHLFKNQQFNKFILATLSLSLLYIANPETLVVFLSVTLVAYFACKWGQNLSSFYKLIILCFLIPTLLTPLFYYKYADFYVNDVFNKDFDTLKDIIIPIGISFYTFQTIAFCIDTLRRNQTVPKFIDYMNFCSFFPQIVAGPIERKDSLLPQMENLKFEFSPSCLAGGIPYILLGLFFKLALADNLANGIFLKYTGENALMIWANNLCFGFRIYFDFAGYGLTAFGIAKCLGINITQNFCSPYTCCNVSDFWRNWHISLTLWFRDYIYFVLGGSRTPLWWFNILLMFLVSGVWHGAGWNFILWGTLCGVTMVIHRLVRKSNIHIPRPIGWFSTMVVMMFIWMFFYITDTTLLLKNVVSLVNPSNYNISQFINILSNNVRSGSLMLCFIPVSLILVLLEYMSKKIYNNPYKLFLNPYSCAIMLIAICMFHSFTPSQFIYFAF